MESTRSLCILLRGRVAQMSIDLWVGTQWTMMGWQTAGR